MSGTEFWLAVLLVALATHGPRASFIVLGRRARLPEALQDALRFAPAAALAAVIAPAVFAPAEAFELLNPRVGAAIAAVLVALRWRNPWLPFIAGMGVLWLLQGLVRLVAG